VTAERLQSENDLSRPAGVLAQRFIQRWDAFPQQLEDGRYICRHEQLTAEHLYDHLKGEITLGTYLLNKENKARFIVFDSDQENGWDELLKTGEKLEKANIPSYLEKSRRGGHLWIFLEHPTDGGIVRKFANTIMEAYHIKGCELFPKQAKVEDGLGSLVRLPFGIHRLTGKRYGFYYPNGELLGNTITQQISALQSIRLLSVDQLKQSNHLASSVEIQNHDPISYHEKSPLSEKIKSQITALDFISRYVELKPTASGAIGRCPFHDDHHPSFGVNVEKNYWHCFAGCGGGSIIDFWSLWRKKKGLDPGFSATITEMARMLF
jgi:hypothetical protein